VIESQFLQRLDELIDMCLGVGGRHLDSQSCFAFGDDGVAEADDEDVVPEELFGHGDGGFGGADDDGADGGGGFEDIEIGLGGDLFAAVLRDVLEPLHAIGLGHEDFDGFVRTGGDRHGQGVTKEGWSAALDDEVDELLGARDESAGPAAESFAQGAGEDVDLADHVVVFLCASSGFAHDAVGVGVVDDEECVVLIAEFSECGEVGDVAFHREDAVGDEPDLARHFRVFLGLFKNFADGVHVGVFVDAFLDTFLDDGGEAHRVDDAGVVEFVGDDDVAGFADGGEECFGRVPARDEGVGCFGAHVFGDGFFEGQVWGEGAADETDGSRARAVFLECFDPGFDDIGMIGEPEVVVRAHADAFMARPVRVDHGDRRVHRRIERLKNLHLPGVGEGVEGLLGAGSEGGNGGLGAHRRVSS